MEWSKLFIPTMREYPKGTESISHSLLIKGGFIKGVASGVYCYLPLGWRVISKVITIIREEMNKIGAQELLLPSLSPASCWEETRRWEEWGEDLFTLKDRKSRAMCLAPTHEEIITDIVRKEVKSYKELPQIWYQIGKKYRDEPRPRGGLLRMREFIMKDSYSMDKDEEGLEENYYKHREAYKKIFSRCGLSFRIVRAPSGVMGGKFSEDFMVEAKGGEDELVVCNHCGYEWVPDFAKFKRKERKNKTQELKKVYTPIEGRVEEVAEFLKVKKEDIIKSILFMKDDTPLLVLVSGDHEISLAKLSKLGEIKEVEFERVKEIVGVGAGFISPVGSEIKVVADVGLRGRKGLVGGGNEENYHYVGIDMSRDIKVEQWLDLEVPNKGDECEVCGNELEFVRTIEVGSIFKLGSHYSTLMGAYFLDEKGRRKPIIMGSYGIGIERLIAAIVETHHDEEGIIWPEEVAPYKVVIILLNPKKEKSKKMKEEVIKKMEKHVSREEILIDERDISVGVKFKDNMLIGVPWQVIIGEKGEKEGKVEIKDRKGEVVKLVSPNKIVEEVC